MKVSILQENLNKALGYVSRCIDNNPPLPVLSHVLLETDESRLKISGTNLETSATVYIGAKVEIPGSITLPSKTFKELVSSLARERIDLTLDQKTDTVEVRCGVQTSNVRGINAEEYPPIVHNSKHNFVLEGESLKEAIDHTAIAVSKESSRPILTGVFIKPDKEKQTITMAAADGYRLSVRDVEYYEEADPYALSNMVDTEEDVSVVIPVAPLTILKSVLNSGDEVLVSFPDERNSVTFAFGNFIVSAQVLEGRYPDFEAILPSGHSTMVKFYTKDALIMCKRAFIFCKDNANIATLSVETPVDGTPVTGCKLSGKSAERGDSEGMLDAHAEGDGVELSFNVKYLMDLLNTVKEERVMIKFNGAESPCLIHPENRDDFSHVIMPMSA